MNALRPLIYQIARLLGDVQAVPRGRIGRRVGRHVGGKLFRKIVCWLRRQILGPLPPALFRTPD